MKKYIIAIMVVMVAIGGMFIFKDKLEEAILNTGMEQAFETDDMYEILRMELEKEEGVAKVTCDKHETDSAVYVISYENGMTVYMYVNGNDVAKKLAA